MVIVIAITNI